MSSVTGEEAVKTLVAMWYLLGGDGFDRCRVIRKPGQPHRGRIIHVSMPVEGGWWVWGRSGRRRGELRLFDRRVSAPKGMVSFVPSLATYHGVDFSSISENLSSITRRAFVPSVFAQLYQANPVLHLLLDGANKKS